MFFYDLSEALQMEFDVVSTFESLCSNNSDKSEAVAAIETLTQLLKVSDVSTIQGLHNVMNTAIADMCESKLSNLSVKSACELFQRFITLANLDNVHIDKCKSVLSQRAEIFIEKVGLSRQHIAENFLNYVPNGAKIFLHSYSRVVLTALQYAANARDGCKPMHCYVTASMPDGSGAKMTKALAKLKISCSLVPDCAIAYLMPQVDLVILGAEAIVESGGILNVLGSSLMAIAASTHGRPVFVLAESFKFIRCYPLNQSHIPDEFKWFSDKSSPIFPLSNKLLNSSYEQHDNDNRFTEMNNNWNSVSKRRISVIEQKMPRIDYTSPSYITYLITDLGVLTPSAVSDELIKLYL